MHWRATPIRVKVRCLTVLLAWNNTRETGPEKTVGKAEGFFVYQDDAYRIVDLPGTYSLSSTSEDEEIARDFILFGNPDVTVMVADATRLERNMNMILQVLQITNKAVLCVNLLDEAKKK